MHLTWERCCKINLCARPLETYGQFTDVDIPQMTLMRPEE